LSIKITAVSGAAGTCCLLKEDEVMKAIVVGSANTDLIIHVNRLPKTGNTEIGYGFKSGPGGKGANQAVALSRLGASTSLIARFGRDNFSSLLRKEIEKYGINLSSAVIDDKLNGGIVFIILDEHGNNTMIADLGSNLSLDAHDVAYAGADFTNADLLLLQFEVSDSANLKACEYAQKNNLPVVLNPAPMRPFNLSLLSSVDIIIPNLQELCELLRAIEGKSVLEQDEKDVKKIGEAASRLITYGVKQSIVTLGNRGSIYVSSDTVQPFGTYRVHQVDSTAAGDAFTAGFAFKYAENQDIGSCIALASACAALALGREGAIPSLPVMREVENFMAKNSLRSFGD